MLRIISKNAQSFFDELEDVDWGEQAPAPPVTPQESLIDDVGEEDIGGIEPFRDDPSSVDFMEEIPLVGPDKKTFFGVPPEAQEIPYPDVESALDDAFSNTEIIAFEYTTRHGVYAGVRIVEPHFTWVANTGNEVLMTYDRTAGGDGDIRSFIIGNIHPNVVRYEGVGFMPKDEIMRGA